MKMWAIWRFDIHTQIAKSFGSTSIRHRSDNYASDRCVIAVEPTVIAIQWIAMAADASNPCVSRARFLSLARSKLRLCSANHRAGYFSNLACDWLSIVWAYSEQETENGPRSSVTMALNTQYRRALVSLRWRHNGRYGVSNHQPHDCLLNRLFRRRSKKTSKLRVTGLCAGNSPGTGEFPAQRASNAEKVSISWRNHAHNECFHIDTSANGSSLVG